MTSNEMQLYNNAVINVITSSIFFKNNINELFYIPQKSADEDIEVFYTIKPGASFTHEDVNEFSDIVNSGVNHKGEKGYFFVYLNLLDEADELTMSEFNERREEIVKYENT